MTLGVEDLETSTGFYRDGLGSPEYEWDGEVSFIETAATWLALFPHDDLAEDANCSPEGSGFRRFTLAHNVESKDAVDRVLVEAYVESTDSLTAERTGPNDRASTPSVT